MLLTEPQVVAVLADTGEAVGLDEGAAWEHVGEPFVGSTFQDVVEAWSAVGEEMPSCR